VLTAGGLLLVRYTFNPVADADTALNDFALLTGAAALGALVGAIVTPKASRTWGSVRWSAAALAQAGVVGITLVIIGAQVPSFPVLLAGGVSLGFAGQSVKVCSDTLVQRHIPDDHLGRVFALFDMIVNVCLVAGITTMAVVSPDSGQTPVLYAAVGLLLVGTAAWYLQHGPRRVRITGQGGTP
jgi:MFS family permease